MEKKEFKKRFRAVLSKYGEATVELKNTDMVYANSYQFSKRGNIWLKKNKEYTGLTELRHIEMVF